MCTYSHVGSWKPIMRSTQQNCEMETSNVGFWSRNGSVASCDLFVACEDVTRVSDIVIVIKRSICIVDLNKRRYFVFRQAWGIDESGFEAVGVLVISVTVSPGVGIVKTGLIGRNTLSGTSSCDVIG